MRTATTTDASVQRDLQASLVKAALESADVCAHRQAERTARLAVSLHDPETFDAAIWKGAEALFNAMDPAGSDYGPLRAQSASVRGVYLTLAVQCLASIRLALEGSYPVEAIQQAFADVQTHRNQLASRRALKAVQ